MWKRFLCCAVWYNFFWWAVSNFGQFENAHKIFTSFAEKKIYLFFYPEVLQSCVISFFNRTTRSHKISQRNLVNPRNNEKQSLPSNRGRKS